MFHKRTPLKLVSSFQGLSWYHIYYVFQKHVFQIIIIIEYIYIYSIYNLIHGMQIGEFKNNHNTFYFYDRAVNIGGTIGQYVIYYQRFYNLNACIHSEQHFLLGNYMY